jgi:hypothetical protein
MISGTSLRATLPSSWGFGIVASGGRGDKKRAPPRREVVEIAAVAGLFNYFNKLNNALGSHGTTLPWKEPPSCSHSVGVRTSQCPSTGKQRAPGRESQGSIGSQRVPSPK